MPRVPADRLHRIGAALLVAAGAPPAEAEIVMRHSVDANLAGGAPAATRSAAPMRCRRSAGTVGTAQDGSGACSGTSPSGSAATGSAVVGTVGQVGPSFLARL